MERAIQLFSVAFLAFVAGVLLMYFKIIPSTALDFLKSGADEIVTSVDRDASWYTQKKEVQDLVSVDEELTAVSAATLVTGAESTSVVSARVFAPDGELIQRWELDWFSIFPDPSHLHPAVAPKSRPGTHPHGAAVMNNGDLVFNFEYMGMARLNPCGEVVWTLHYQTHHSIFIDEQGMIWAAGKTSDQEGAQGQFRSGEPTVVRVTPDGTIDLEFKVLPLYSKADLDGLHYYSKSTLLGASKLKDLHLNDVEVFPSTMEPGFFEAGDILLSLRNNNQVLVLRKDLTVKTFIVGPFIRQHDPDFIDGDTIILFDNNHRAGQEHKTQSRILAYNAAQQSWSTEFEGTPALPFFTAIMGKQQPLENGNLIVTESMKGRALELNPEGQVVWDFVNDLGDGYVGVMEEAQRLPASFDANFFQRQRSLCQVGGNGL